MSADQAELIEQVLGDVVDIGANHPAATELANVHARDIAARRAALVPEHGNVIRPGDVLIIGGSTTMTHRDAAELKERLMARLPGIADVIVMPGVTVEGIYRGGAP